MHAHFFTLALNVKFLISCPLENIDKISRDWYPERYIFLNIFFLSNEAVSRIEIGSLYVHLCIIFVNVGFKNNMQT